MRLFLAAALVLICATPVAAETASSFYKKGRKAESKGDFGQAYLYYSQAFAADPSNQTYWARSQSVRGRAAQQESFRAQLLPKPAAGPVIPSPPDEEPEQDEVAGTITAAELIESRRALPVPELRPSSGRFDFSFRGTNRELFEYVARICGLLAVFDGDYQQAPNLRIDLVSNTCTEALHAAESVTSSFIVPVKERLMLVARDTAQKRTELEPHTTVVIPFPEPLTTQDVQEAARAVQSTFDMQKVTVDTAKRLILIRDRVSRVRPAQALLLQLMRHRGQVVTEVELLAVTTNSSLNYGLRLQTSFPLVNFGHVWNSAPSIPAGFTRFLTFGAGKTFLGLGIADAEIFASMSKANTRSVLKAEMRSLDSQAATLHLGDRYPILTQGYFGEIDTPGQVFRPPPTINFEDLGVVIKLTPRVHDQREVSLEVEAEFKSLTGQTLNGIPVIANRKFTGRVRMKFEEAAIMAGLTTVTASKSWTGLPLLSAIPFLRSNVHDTNESEVLLVLRPRLVSEGILEHASPPFWVGTESRSRSLVE